jgi:predicted dehydrogenase
MTSEARITRRRFIKKACCASSPLVLPYFVPRCVFGKTGTRPSERITIGAIGIGDQGTNDLKGFLQLPNAQIVAVCDVSRPARQRGLTLVNDKYGNSDCGAYHDFQDMLQRKDIDAISVVTPYHWHSLMALAALRSGKDVFMEKPVALSVQEGMMLREAVHRYDSVFQLGTQQRSGRNFRFACELALNGRLGRVHTVKVGTSRGRVTSNLPPMPVPDWLDYDRWLGPALWSAYNEKKMIRDFHENISDFSLGMIHCWGIHHLDIAQWGAGTENTGPFEIWGTGTFPRDGTCDCILGWDVTMKFANDVTMSFTDSTGNAHGIRFEGDQGWVFVNRGTLKAEPDSLLKEQIGPDEQRLPVSTNHFQDFLDAVRTRKRPISPIDVAIRSDTLCHLSYISIQLGRKLRWDAEREQFTDDTWADRLLLPRPMRSPWHL